MLTNRYLFLDMLMVKDREILNMKGEIAEMIGIGNVSMTGMSAAPGGFPATTRSSASSGPFNPYSNHNSTENHHGEIGVLDLPAGTELSKLAGLGLDSIESSSAVTR